MERNRLLGLQISSGTYQSFIDRIIDLAVSRRSDYVCVANVHMLIEAHRNKDFASMVNGASLVTPDGKPLSWALKFLYGLKQERVAGMDMLPDLLALASEKKLPVYFYGGMPAMLDQTHAFLKEHYPNLKIAGLESPPFSSLTIEEEEETIERINRSGSAIVLVILGCPKQEKWMALMKNKINAVMIGLGGALPVLIGMQKRAPRWMQDAGMEWIYRLVQEPKRLFKRYLSTNTAFMVLFFRDLIRLRMLNKGY